MSCRDASIQQGSGIDGSVIGHIGPGRGVDQTAPDWRPIGEMSLLILVGVTGVGKTTMANAIREAGVDFTLLPNRRELTDRLIIQHMQQLDGQPPHAVTDRQARFDYTRRYREHYPGGMAHALSQLRIDPAHLDGLLLFDGLRGVNEVSHAAALLPAARFIVLDAPDVVRVQRLLGRNDAFDQIGGSSAATDGGEIHDFAGLGLHDAQPLFSERDEQALLSLVHTGAVTADDLAAKLRIVVTERRNYDPAATIEALNELAPARTIVIDTVQMTPAQAAETVAAAL